MRKALSGRQRHARGLSARTRVPPRARERINRAGLGEKLLDRAEQISVEEFQAKQVLVNSGIGVKEYYRRLGFSDLGPYLAKSLDE